jgi:hypothetical protein
VSATLEEVRKRHASYTAHLVVDHGVPLYEAESVAYCARCGLAWPCDAAALVEVVSRLRAALEAARPRHLVVDGDCWYSCPKAPSEWGDGSACCDGDAVARGACTCGADRKNAAIDEALR